MDVSGNDRGTTVPAGRPSALKRRRDVPERRIVDATGRKWCLYEVEHGAPSGGDSSESRSLIAEDEGVIRRLRTFPDDWYRMTDAQLVQLVEGRVTSR